MDSENTFKVRTLLDSGTEASWITRDILKFVKYKRIDQVRLKVRHFNGVQDKMFELVKVYIRRKNKYKVSTKSRRVWETLDCLVYEGFFHHKMVKGVKEFLKSTGRVSPDLCDQVVEPSDEEVGHKDINLGIGLVLSDAAKIKIMESNSQAIILRSQNLLLQPTIFGYAVSGRIPPTLTSSIKDIQVGFSSPLRVVGEGVPETSFYFIGNQNTLCSEKGDSEYKVRQLCEKEHSLGVLIKETNTNEDPKDTFETNSVSN